MCPEEVMIYVEGKGVLLGSGLEVLGEWLSLLPDPMALHGVELRASTQKSCKPRGDLPSRANRARCTDLRVGIRNTRLKKVRLACEVQEKATEIQSDIGKKGQILLHSCLFKILSA